MLIQYIDTFCPFFVSVAKHFRNFKHDRDKEKLLKIEKWIWLLNENEFSFGKVPLKTELLQVSCLNQLFK